jgi:hypothetical protein
MMECRLVHVYERLDEFNQLTRQQLSNGHSLPNVIKQHVRRTRQLDSS